MRPWRRPIRVDVTKHNSLHFLDAPASKLKKVATPTRHFFPHHLATSSSQMWQPPHALQQQWPLWPLLQQYEWNLANNIHDGGDAVFEASAEDIHAVRIIIVHDHPYMHEENVLEVLFKAAYQWVGCGKANPDGVIFHQYFCCCLLLLIC